MSEQSPQQMYDGRLKVLNFFLFVQGSIQLSIADYCLPSLKKVETNIFEVCFHDLSGWRGHVVNNVPSSSFLIREITKDANRL